MPVAPSSFTSSSPVPATYLSLVLVLDWRTTNEIVFETLRRQIVDQCSNFLNLYALQQLQMEAERRSLLLISIKLLMRDRVHVLLDHFPVLGKDACDGHTDAHVAMFSRIHHEKITRKNADEHRAPPLRGLTCVMAVLNSLLTDTMPEVLSAQGNAEIQAGTSVPQRLRILLSAILSDGKRNMGTAAPSSPPRLYPEARDDRGSLPQGSAHRSVIVVTSSYMSCENIFTAFSLFTTMRERESGGEGGGAVGGDEIHALAVDTDAVCLTTAEFGRPSSPLSDSEPAPPPNLQRLYRSSPDPSDMRLALQMSVAEFLLPSPRVPVLLQLSGNCSLPCVARRPYLADLHRCSQSRNSPLHNTATSRSTTGATPERSRRHSPPPAPIHPYMHSEGERARLEVEAVLSPELVDELYLYGDSWVLSPVSAASDVWQAAFHTFASDVLLMRSQDSRLQRTHAVTLPRMCFIGFLRDRSHMVLRQVIPMELRREVIAAPHAPHSAASDAALRRMAEAREAILQRGDSRLPPMAEVLKGDVRGLLGILPRSQDPESKK